MHAFVDEVQKEISARRLCARGQPILVAVSGGVDSMVLLEVLRLLASAPEHQWRLVVAHFNHQLRGEASDADERFVRETAEQAGLPFLSGTADISQLAREEGGSVEMVARRERHAFFAGAAARESIPTVALGHHADDQVELFFLRLLRGAGSAGLQGMPWLSPSPARPGLNLVRPLLGQGRASILGFARDMNLTFREDASNQACDILRNRIRHRLIPFLTAEFQPALQKIIARQMEILSGESAFVRESALAWLEGTRPSEFDQLPVAVQRCALQEQLLRLGLVPDYPLIEVLRLSAQKAVSVGSSRGVIRDQAGHLSWHTPGQAGFDTGMLEVDLSVAPAVAQFGEVSLAWRFEPSHGQLPPPEPNCEWFDADKVGSPIRLRHWRPGDRFQPIGMPEAAKLQDLLTNLKFPRLHRHCLVVATTGSGEIWWVEGIRMAEGFKLRPDSVRCLRWHWVRAG